MGALWSALSLSASLVAVQCGAGSLCPYWEHGQQSSCKAVHGGTACRAVHGIRVKGAGVEGARVRAGVCVRGGWGGVLMPSQARPHLQGITLTRCAMMDMR